MRNQRLLVYFIRKRRNTPSLYRVGM